MSIVDYTAEAQHDGRLHIFPVRDLKLPMCGTCREKVFTDDADRQVRFAMRTYLGLLAPNQIRDAIQRVGLSQQDVSKGLGITEETLSRWLNETEIQSQAMDHLMRAFFAFPQVRMAFCVGEQDPWLGTEDIVSSAKTI